MVHNFYHGDVTSGSITSDCIEKPSEGRQVNNVEIFQSIFRLQGFGNATFLDNLAVLTIGQQNGLESMYPPHD